MSFKIERDIFLSLVAQTGYNENLIACQRREKKLVSARRWIVKELRAKGWSYPTIAFHMNRDHTSIRNLDKTIDAVKKQ